MIFLIPVLCEVVINWFDSNAKRFMGDVNPVNKYIFKSIPSYDLGTSTSFFYIAKHDHDDIIKKSTKSDPNPDVNSDWTQITDGEINKIIFNKGPLTLMIIPARTHSVDLRGGYTRPDICSDGTLLTLSKNYKINKNSIGDTPLPHTYCVIFLHMESKATISSLLNNDDNLQYLDRADSFGIINNRYNGQITSTEIPVYIVAKISRSRSNTRALYVDIDTSGYGYDYDTTDSVKENQDNVYVPTPTNSPYPTPKKTLEDTPARTPKRSPWPKRTVYPGTPKPTPDQTWDGKWLDPTNVIIRGEEIPEIQETYPPLQTKYIKTAVPKAKKIVTFTTGTAAIIGVVILTIINGFRTYKKLHSNENEYECSESEWDMSSSFYFDSYTETY